MFALFLLLTEGSFYRSGASENGDAAAQRNIPGETDRDLVAFHNHGYLHLAAGIGQHFFQFLRVLMHIDIYGTVGVGCPSLVTEGSDVRSVDDDLRFHKSSCVLNLKLPPEIISF